MHAADGVGMMAADDMSSVASTTVVLGLVRARQGFAEEAEALIRKGVAITEGTDYIAERWEHYLSLAAFLLSQGRAEEAKEWIAKLRDIIALYGPESPLLAYVERRLAGNRAAEVVAGAMRHDGDSQRA